MRFWARKSRTFASKVVEAMCLSVTRQHHRARWRRLQTLNEREPLVSNRMHLQQVEQRRRWFAVERHEVIVGVVPEQLRTRLEDMSVVLDESFRAGVRLPNLALGPIAAEEPVVA